MPPTAPSPVSPITSARPAATSQRANAHTSESSLLASPPASRRGDLVDPNDAASDPAPTRRRGRGQGNPAPPAAVPAVLTRAILWRLWTIHTILSERQSRLTSADQLAKDLGTCPRSVRRDIATMQHSLRLPIETREGHGGGYRYARRHVAFAAAPASASELLAVAVAAQMVRAYAGTRLEEDVRGALRRLRLDVRAERALDLDALGEVLSFRGTGFDRLTDLDLFQKVTIAALNREELSFSYLGGEDDRARERTARPLHVYSEENAWYVLSRDVPTGEIRRFNLGRMRKVRATGRRFVRPRQDEQAVADLDDALGAFGGGKPIRVVLRFRGRPARAVRERHWHHSQKVRVIGPKETELKLRVPETPGLLYFALRWGQDVRVLEPASLREAVLANARTVLAQG